MKERVHHQYLLSGFVIPAQAGIQFAALDFRLSGNDMRPRL
jgi:hypothetical protein